MSVSIDQNSTEIIEKLSNKNETSKSKIIRKALRYYEVIEKKGKVSSEDLEIYMDFLENGEHIIADIGTWHSFFNEVGNHSENFLERTYEIGSQHWDEYKDKGIKNIDEILDYVEKTGWYTLNKDREGAFTLVMKVHESTQFVKHFLMGLFEASPYEVELNEGYGKLRVKVL